LDARAESHEYSEAARVSAKLMALADVFGREGAADEALLESLLVRSMAARTCICAAPEEGRRKRLYCSKDSSKLS
jgi:hypothetical protein